MTEKVVLVADGVIYSKCTLCGVEFKGESSPRTVQENAFVSLLEHFRQTHKGKGHTCGRRVENGMDSDDSPFKLAGSNRDFWHARDGREVCSYCGSISEEEFYKRVDSGEEIIPTDKSYKAYLQPDHAKFYFQHLSREGMQRFVDYINTNKFKYGIPGYFYVRPYFVGFSERDTRPKTNNEV